MEIWKESCGYLSNFPLHTSPQCLSTSHVPAQGRGEENQHLSYSYPPRISAPFCIISSQTKEENSNNLPNPCHIVNNHRNIVTFLHTLRVSPSPSSHPKFRSSTQRLSNPSILAESRKNVYIRFSEHHGQGILLDLRGSVEAHGIDSLQELWFPEKRNFHIMTYLSPFSFHLCTKR